MSPEYELNKRIDKLEQKLDTWTKRFMSRIEALEKQLTELKEQVALQSLIQNKSVDVQLTLEEVLREFFKEMIEHYKCREDKPFEFWERFFIEILAKLDGEKAGSARQTVKSIGVVEWNGSTTNTDIAYSPDDIFPNEPPEKFYWKNGKIWITVAREELEKMIKAVKKVFIIQSCFFPKEFNDFKEKYLSEEE